MTFPIIVIILLVLWVIGLTSKNGELTERARSAEAKAAHLQRLVDMCRRPGVN